MSFCDEARFANDDVWQGLLTHPFVLGLADAISPSMKHSFAVGIGLFLAFLGLYQTGIVTSFVEGVPAKEARLTARPDAPETKLLAKPDVPVTFVDHTAGYDSECAVLFPETVCAQLSLPCSQIATTSCPCSG